MYIWVLYFKYDALVPLSYKNSKDKNMSIKELRNEISGKTSLRSLFHVWAIRLKKEFLSLSVRFRKKKLRIERNELKTLYFLN